MLNFLSSIPLETILFKEGSDTKCVQLSLLDEFVTLLGTSPSAKLNSRR